MYFSLMKACVSRTTKRIMQLLVRYLCATLLIVFCVDLLLNLFPLTTSVLLCLSISHLIIRCLSMFKNMKKIIINHHQHTNYYVQGVQNAAVGPNAQQQHIRNEVWG